MKLTYYLSPSRDAYLNLAQDEFFLTHLPPDTHLLYCYINDNAVIIGRNQNAFAECDLAAMNADSVQLVRRITGGGAVYHDCGNLNFSFLSPADCYDTDVQDEIILSALRSLGIDAEKNGRNDFSVNGRKFSGNAFGGKGQNKVRHGTLLIDSDLTRLSHYLTVSAKKLRAKGVSSVRSRVCNLREFAPDLTAYRGAEAILRAFESHYGLTAETLTLSNEDKAEIAALRDRRASFDWVMGEAPAFDYSFEERFSFGMANLCLSVADGVITRADLYTDALDTTLPDTLRTALTGTIFTPESVCRTLAATGKTELRELGEYVFHNL